MVPIAPMMIGKNPGPGSLMDPNESLTAPIKYAAQTIRMPEMKKTDNLCAIFPTSEKWYIRLYVRNIYEPIFYVKIFLISLVFLNKI